MKTIEQKNILIVEDDLALLQNLSAHFSKHNIVREASCLRVAFDLLDKNNEFDIILLDLILPDGNGFQLLKKVSGTPVVILSDLGAEEQILQGFDEGAVDYIVKPASISIIEARMALRLLPAKQAVLSKQGLTVDARKRTVYFGDKPIALTSNEFNVLLFLMQNSGQNFSAEEIYERVWKMPHLNTQTVRIHLHNLRKKMCLVSEECGNLIITEFGKGYAFCGGKNENG